MKLNFLHVEPEDDADSVESYSGYSTSEEVSF